MLAIREGKVKLWRVGRIGLSSQETFISEKKNIFIMIATSISLFNCLWELCVYHGLKLKQCFLPLM